MLSDLEKQRYSRHLLLKEIGGEGQLKLKKANVLVIGAGGLGCPVIQYLAAAGIGHIGIVDHDKVDISNLQRQILFDVNGIGKSKADEAEKKIGILNPHVKISVYAEHLTATLALKLFTEYDIIVDCTDNFKTRYLINDVCVMVNKPFVVAALHKYEGQLALFNAKEKVNRSSTYRCVFPEKEKVHVPNCSQAGVLGVLPGVMGVLQATEVIKYITGIGENLINKLYILNILNFESMIIDNKRNEEYYQKNRLSADQLIKKYDQVVLSCTTISKINKEEALMRHNHGNALLIDLRNPEEIKIFNESVINIPMHELPDRLDELRGADTIIFGCQAGARSNKATEYLKSLDEFKGKDIYYLSGCIDDLLTHVNSTTA